MLLLVSTASYAQSPQAKTKTALFQDTKLVMYPYIKEFLLQNLLWEI